MVKDVKSTSVTSVKDELASSASSISSEENTVVVVNVDNGEVEKINKDWTQEEEDRASRKLDLFIMPLLFFAFFILQVDRGNISNALTSTLSEDIGLDNDKINAGTALFNVGIVVFEIPSNIIMQRIGPSKWLSFQIIVWSLCATLQSTITNYKSFLAIRFFIGVLESGYIPGGLYYISTWYTRRQLTPRYTLYFIGNMSASAASSLIAAGILKNVAGNFGLAGWKWIFIIEGVLGIGYGLIFAALLPESPLKPSPFWGGFRILSERESRIIRGRVLLDDPEKISSSSHISLNDLKDTFKQWRIWLHFLFTMSFMQSTQALGTYIPSIVKSLGYSSVAANAMSSIGSWCSVVMVIILTSIIKFTKVHSYPVIFITLWQLVFSTVLFSYSSSGNKNVKFACLACLQISGTIGHVLNCSWTSTNIQKPAHRSIALAMLVMAANIAGICAGQILRTNDLPNYTHAFLALMILSIFSVFVAISIFIQYTRSNKVLDKKYPQTGLPDEETPQVTIENTLIAVGKNVDEAKLSEQFGNMHIKTSDESFRDAIINKEKFRYII